MRRGRKLLRLLGGARSVLMDAAGLGLLATAAFTWSVTAGFMAAGVAVLGLNWRISEGSE
ncbi:hypothetical protein HEP81_06552 [Streptomyces griseofuscus]|uniref:Uncharacterized protein n=1 Tax=Streptomyces griseofuscus TaxID=146922 RepID=A0A7H1Q907_9ACTN|nr:hypothetical protein HEP81_06552 [Streptomyces griseofuscus]